MELAAGFDPRGTLSAKSPAPESKRGSRTKRGPLTLFEREQVSSADR